MAKITKVRIQQNQDFHILLVWSGNWYNHFEACWQHLLKPNLAVPLLQAGPADTDRHVLKTRTGRVRAALLTIA